jgi:hypothetical protein
VKGEFVPAPKIVNFLRHPKSSISSGAQNRQFPRFGEGIRKSHTIESITTQHIPTKTKMLNSPVYTKLWGQQVVDEPNAKTAAVHAKLWGKPTKAAPTTPQKIEPYKLPKSLTLYSVADACVEWDDNIYARRSEGGYKSVKMCEMKRFYQLERIVEYITDNPHDTEKAKNMLNTIIHNPRKPQKKAKELNGKPGTTTTIKSGCWEWSVKFTHEGARFGKYPIKFK